jgi:hypothetical protein
MMSMDSSNVLDRMQMMEPMKWQGWFMDEKTNRLSLKAMREWLSAEWYEKVSMEDEYPEFAFMEDDGIVLEMQHELLASLN